MVYFLTKRSRITTTKQARKATNDNERKRAQYSQNSETSPTP